MQNPEEELKVLSHEAWPGFKKAFVFVFTALTVYLALILLSSPDGGHLGHHDSHAEDAHHGSADHHDESDGH